MNILLLGHKGYLGSYLHKHLDCYVAESDWGRDAPDLQYDYVINCIAKTDMQWCEDNPVESMNVNAALVSNLSMGYPEAKLINFSSYYVYDTEELATENHPLAKTSLQYIQHKIIGEQWNTNGINFRIGKLFGNPDRKQNKLTDYILDNATLQLDKHKFNPCSCKCILKILQNLDFLKNATGNFNLANTGVTDPELYARFILQKTGTSKSIELVTRQPFPNYGRFAMDLSKIQQHLELDPWEKDMEEYLNCIALVK